VGRTLEPPFSGATLNPAKRDADKYLMKPKGGRLLRALMAAAMVATAAATAVGPAQGADLETVREQAQTVADEVSALEHQLADLNAKQQKLDRAIVDATRDIALIELQMGDLHAERSVAQERYIERAVQAYKSGATYKLAVLLSARDFNELATILRATEEATQLDERSLTALSRSTDALEQAQETIDDRKQKLMSARNEAVAVETEIASTLDQRRALFEQLTTQIKQLEEEARRLAAQRAARERRTDEELLKLLAPSGPAPDIPDGFVGTGVSFEGIASWYGPGFEGQSTASGDIFDPDLYTAASKELPLGTWLFVTHGSQGVVVLVNDRGPYVGGRVLDLSQAAAEAIGIGGLGWVRAEILLKA
jgi:rare lipoprotein A